MYKTIINLIIFIRLILLNKGNKMATYTNIKVLKRSTQKHNVVIIGYVTTSCKRVRVFTTFKNSKMLVLLSKQVT